ncbi:MAG: tRNA (adenosine(37)-N6)-threonylcarbamoyltransferase complex transferase subunit TsaD [Rhodothermia bacterium]|nr:MAG: tRNA (adenosine(37)-N6)-threonylcarbamoyltransferase complex transferase subunit TsaD [Rhodothermia bacterium]
MYSPPVLLGIETSCDDTAAAAMADGKLLSSIVSTQEDHSIFGGVVPELASRAHQRLIVPIIDEALTVAGLVRSDLDAIAVTIGPGLAGSLLVGLSMSKALSLGLGIPLIGINHLEGHIYSLFIDDKGPTFPFLCLIVSGGHTQLVKVEANFEHTVLGRTRDDAAGEAFDKVAKLLGLGYPGGPGIEKLAAEGDPSFHDFPRTRLQGYDYSFSGIKTSVLYYLNAVAENDRLEHIQDNLADICASFQEAVVDMLTRPIIKAARETGIRDLALVGGVSANMTLQTRMKELAQNVGGRLFVPDQNFCMDNAAMIALAGHHKLVADHTSALTLTVDPSLALV